MVIRKDPETPPAETIEFREVFSDINTPEYWIAESETDLSPKFLVLDGHSSILVYSKETEELNWEAYNEIGQYEYIPKNIGDGIITFPHTFYFEFGINLSERTLEVSGSFDGTGIQAIIMPMKDVLIEDFVSSLKSRFNGVFSSELKTLDDSLTIEENKKLDLSEGILTKLSLKLALMGINLQKLTVLKVQDIKLKESEVVEEIFEVPEEVKKEKKKDTRARKKGKAPAKVSPPAEEPSPLPAAPTAGPTSPPPGVPGGPPPSTPTVKPKPAPPAATANESALPPTPPPATPDAKPSPARSMAAPPSTPPAAPPPPAQPAPAPPPAKGGGGPPAVDRAMATEMDAEVLSIDDELSADDIVGDIFVEEEEEDELDLYATGMKREEEKTMDLRYTHAEWFDKMVINKVYPLIVKISTEQMRVKKSVSDHISGERISEAAGEMVVDVSSKMTIRPDFPGSIVVPTQHEVDLDEDKIEVKFHVTPLARATLDASIKFIQEGEIIHSMDLETRVITHRISTISATLGVLSGALPAIIAFFFGVPPGQFMTNNLEVVMPAVASLGYGFPALLTGLLVGGGAGYRYLQKPIQQKRSVAFPR